MAAGARTLLVELLIATVWTDVTAYVRQSNSTPVTITRGFQDEQGRLTPSTCTLTLDDADGRFRPRNPTGPYYPNLSRVTPLRVSIDGTRRFFGEITSLTPQFDVARAAPSVRLLASGPFRRLHQGAFGQLSALDRYLRTETGVVGYWPLTDPAVAVRAV